ncbi:hypothetical protein CBL_07958 [Carabus blaptoides fortunei]
MVGGGYGDGRVVVDNRVLVLEMPTIKILWRLKNEVRQPPPAITKIYETSTGTAASALLAHVTNLHSSWSIDTTRPYRDQDYFIRPYIILAGNNAMQLRIKRITVLRNCDPKPDLTYWNNRSTRCPNVRMTVGFQRLKGPKRRGSNSSKLKAKVRTVRLRQTTDGRTDKPCVIHKLCVEALVRAYTLARMHSVVHDTLYKIASATLSGSRERARPGPAHASSHALAPCLPDHERATTEPHSPSVLSKLKPPGSTPTPTGNVAPIRQILTT